MKKSVIRYYFGYRVVHECGRDDRGNALFYFICDNCGVRKFKSTAKGIRERGECKCKKLKKVVVEKKPKVVIDTQLARRMARFMTAYEVARRLGVSKEDVIRIL